MDKLAKEIQVSERVLQHYLASKDPIPIELLLKLIDVVLKRK